jgi:hypothetical protein
MLVIPFWILGYLINASFFLCHLDVGLQQIAFLLNTRRDVPVERLYAERLYAERLYTERLYRVLGFMHVPPKPEICCI